MQGRPRGGTAPAAPPGTGTPPDGYRTGEPEPGAGGVGKRAASPWADGFGRLAVRSGQALLVAVATAAAVWVLVRLRLVVVPLLIATLLAAAVSPLVGALSRRGLPRGLAAMAALLTGLGAIGLLVWLIVAGVRDEWQELRDRASEGLEELERFLTSGPLGLEQQQLEQARTAVVNALSGEEAQAGAVEGATVAAEAVAGVFLAVVLLYFLLKDGQRIWDFLLRPLPADREVLMHRVGERSVDVLGGYVRGTAVVALVDAVIIGLALVILGVPLALPLAVVVFLGAFIPLAGATIAGALAALVALVANGPVTALIVLGVVIAVNQVEGDVLAPLVLGRALSLHPLAVLLALTAGTIVAGIIGALLAVPLVAVAWTAIVTWTDETRQARAGQAAGAAPAS